MNVFLHEIEKNKWIDFNHDIFKGIDPKDMIVMRSRKNYFVKFEDDNGNVETFLYDSSEDSFRYPDIKLKNDKYVSFAPIILQSTDTTENKLGVILLFHYSKSKIATSVGVKRFMVIE